MKTRTVDGKQVWRLEETDMRKLREAKDVCLSIVAVSKDEDATVTANTLDELMKKYAPPPPAPKKKEAAK